jgi:hypothetical protein
MNPSAPSTSTSTSVPGGPLGRYLLHPGSDTSTVVHHVLHLLAGAGRVAIPALLAAVALLVAGRLVLALTRRQRAGDGHLVTVAPRPEVESAGAEALGNGLHGVLRRGGLAGRGDRGGPAEGPLPGGAGITGGESRLAGPERFSLRVDQPADPYRLLLAALAGLGAGETGVVQVLARPATHRR